MQMTHQLLSSLPCNPQTCCRFLTWAPGNKKKFPTNESFQNLRTSSQSSMDKHRLQITRVTKYNTYIYICKIIPKPSFFLRHEPPEKRLPSTLNGSKALVLGRKMWDDAWFLYRHLCLGFALYGLSMRERDFFRNEKLVGGFNPFEKYYPPWN